MYYKRTFLEWSSGTLLDFDSGTVNHILQVF